MISVPFSDSEIAFLAQVVKSNLALKSRQGISDPAAAVLANKLVFLALAMRPGERFYVQIGKAADVESQKDDDIKFNWQEEATDEHLSFDPRDPISPDEVVWMSREIESGDMTPEEFLRRSA